MKTNDTVRQTGENCYAVVHGHPDTGGARDKPKGSVIKEFCGEGAAKKAYAMHTAIANSQQKARDCKFNG